MADDHETDGPSLSDIFDEGLELFNDLSKSSEATNSTSIQRKVHEAMHLFENATELVSLTGMFSSNETVDEIHTSNLKFLLLPALLGTLSLKLCGEDRMKVVETAEVYFRDYLKRCKDYGITDVEMAEPATNDPKSASKVGSTSADTDLIAMARDRNAKLQRYKEQKLLESQLEELRKTMDGSNVDDEVKRKFYLTMIRSYINQAVDEIGSIIMEKPLIEHMQKVKKDKTLAHEYEEKRVRPPKKPLKPIIITRDEVQKKVFGAGHPSLPTMTVQEFYDQKVQQGDFPDPNAPQQARTLQEMARLGIQDDPEKEAEEKERQIEQDDPEALRRARDFDEFKDDHRRGYGNRMNRS